jgi:HEAT repeat protein
MHDTTRGLLFRRFAYAACSALLVFAVAGCGSGSASRALNVFKETIAADPQYASYAIKIAKDSPSAQARAEVIGLMASSHYPTALEAVKAIEDDPPADALAPLEAVFADKKGALKLQAAVALSRMGNDDAYAWLRDQIVSGAAAFNLPALQVAAERGDVDLVVDSLRGPMSSDSLATRDEVYSILGALGKPWATDLLLEGLDHEHGEDRQGAITALGHTGEPRVAEKIKKFANTQGLVFATLEALGELGNPDTLEAARLMTKHEEALVRLYAGVATWRLGDAETARATLEPMVVDEDVTLREVLAEQLAFVEAPQAREWLATLARDPERDVKISALRSLAAEPGAGEAEVFLEAARESDYEVASLGLNALAEVGTPDLVSEIAPMMDSGNPYLRLSAANAVLALSAEGNGGA